MPPYTVARLFADTCALVSDPWLRRACELAERGRGTTSPNPVVGCVLVAGGSVVGEGFHERAGGPHAEVAALRAAGESARGATAYVTLEPCNHAGRTPACTDALARAGVARVVIGMRDPNVTVAGGGAEQLAAGGIEVAFAEDPAPFEEQLVEWSTFVREGRPFVRVKIAVTLDGRPALAHGVRSQLTGQGASEVTMRLRRRADAVLAGAGTIATDDPSLTVRDAEGSHDARQPKRVVLVEAGPRLFSALWESDLVDELVLYHAGGVAGEQAPALFVGESQEDPTSLTRRMRAVEAGCAGSDAVTVWRRSGAGELD